MKPKAVFDVGTNSVKMLVAVPGEGGMEILADEVRICALGEGLHERGSLSEAAMSRVLAALAELAALAAGFGVDEVAAIGTEALRRASNGEDFIERLRRKTGLELGVIPGEEEARLSFLAALSCLEFPEGDLVAFDVGGGSTEFSFGSEGRIGRRISLPVGCIRFTDSFLPSDPSSPEELDRLVSALDGELSEIEGKADTLVGIGGTATTLGSVMLRLEPFDAARIRGLRIEASEIDRQVELYRSRKLEERRAIIGLHPDRAPLILAGAAIIRAVMRRLGCPVLTLSDRALRHGLFQDLWLR